MGRANPPLSPWEVDEALERLNDLLDAVYQREDRLPADATPQEVAERMLRYAAVADELLPAFDHLLLNAGSTLTPAHRAMLTQGKALICEVLHLLETGFRV